MMTKLIRILSGISVLLFAIGCSPNSGGGAEKVVDLELYLTAPFTEASEELLPAEIVALLEPLTCSEKSQLLVVNMSVTRLDMNPVKTERVEVPLTTINGLRVKTKTYTFDNRLANFAEQRGNTPNAPIFYESGNGTPDLSKISEQDVLYCCGNPTFGGGKNIMLTTLDATPEYLKELVCTDDLPDVGQLAFLYQAGNREDIIPTSSPPVASTLETQVTEALNYLGNQDLPRGERYAAISSYSPLFTADADVKIYGDNGTVVVTEPVSKYLERISNYISIDSIYVDEVLEENGLCWEVRIREIHNR